VVGLLLIADANADLADNVSRSSLEFVALSCMNESSLILVVVLKDISRTQSIC
jgi:hypothetical protein